MIGATSVFFPCRPRPIGIVCDFAIFPSWGGAPGSPGIFIPGSSRTKREPRGRLLKARARSIQNPQKATIGRIYHFVKSRMYVFRRQRQEAISELERGLALAPNDPACHFNMGYSLTLASRAKDAIEFLKRGMTAHRNVLLWCKELAPFARFNGN
jgi:hypothetical protein